MKTLLILTILSYVIVCSACFMDSPQKYLKEVVTPIITTPISITGKQLQQPPIITIKSTPILQEIKSINNTYSNSYVKLEAGVSYKYSVSIKQTNDKIVQTTSIKNLSTNQQKVETETFDANLYGVWNQKVYPITFRQSMPLAINTQFSGFGQGEKITRACLLYLNKNGRWVVIVNLKNPKNIVSNSGQNKTPFGKNCIQYSYGYQPGEILYVLTYYESQNFATHDLKKLLTQKTINPSTINGAIAIGIVQNVRPR